MSAPSSSRPARNRRLVALLGVAALLASCVVWGRPGPAGAAGGGPLIAEPVVSAAAAGVRQLLGPSAQEAPGEIWGVANASGGRELIVRYTDAGGWQNMPDPVDAEGRSVTGLQVPLAALAGRTTATGGVAVLANVPATTPPQVLLVRDRGGQFRVAPAPPLEGKETLFTGEKSSLKVVAVDEPGGRTGAYAVPDPGTGLAKSVLHYDGTEWTREQLCLGPAPEPCKAPAAGFSILGIDATGAGNAWLLARQPKFKAIGEAIVLLRREGSEWRQQTLGGSLGALYASEESVVGGTKVFVAGREKKGQPLTVTSSGVWVDATVAVGSATPRSDATIYYDIGSSQVTGSWCELPETTAAAVREEVCKAPLGSELAAGEGRSYAWPPAPGDQFGTRAITGVGQGAMLIFEAGSFTRIPLAGGGGSSAGAALFAPDQGWLGPSYRLTRAPVPSGLQPWPVPFRRPLTAIASEPGEPVAGLSSEALAVGDRGQVARYLPGQGWQPEPLLTGTGTRATPDLRGVAWPRRDLAFAVGDGGAMWLWRASSGLWEPDPGAPPNLIRGNFTGIAFDAANPDRGYAVGKQGLLLRYGRRWTQEALPPGLDPEVNITSIAFAGSEALATYTLAVSRGPNQFPTYTGGLLVNDGAGWRVEEAASAALAPAEAIPSQVAPRRVAGLPDGGAVVAGARGGVIVRDGPGAPWRAVPGPPVGFPVAAAAIREGGQLRAVLAVEANASGRATAEREQDTDRFQAEGQPASGQPSLLTEPYPLPKNGFLIRETANGWRDEQRQSFPLPTRVAGQSDYDLPRVPDAVLALLIHPDGTRGWAVGGNTGEIVGDSQLGSFLREGLQSGSAMRYGADAAPPVNADEAPIPTPSDEATFAIGAGATCVAPCADLVGTGIGPDVWLRAAVGRAATIPGVRAFVYAGDSVAPSAATTLSRTGFREEESAYARRLSSGAGALPVYAAPAASDRYSSSLTTFAAAFGGFPQPLGAAPEGQGITAVGSGDRANGNYSYAFDSRGGTGGAVRVIVLDFSVAPVGTEKQCWLAGQLAAARTADPPRPAIVVGSRAAGGDAGLRQLLVTGENGSCTQAKPGAASAYFFKGEGNREGTLAWQGSSIPTFGTGSLAYNVIPNTERNQYVPAAGFLLASVETAARDSATNIAPVKARLIPSLGSLAIDALDGTLLRRSQTALFQALARRPLAGIRCSGSIAPLECDGVAPDAYVQIPTRCVSNYGAPCAAEIPPEYAFTSSRPDVANFVKVDPVSSSARAVFLGKDGKPVADASSGLLCAFNAGSTVITVTAGGLTYSVPITVQKGSVQRPCGTVPLTDRPVQPQVAPPPAAPLPNQTPTFTDGPGTLPPPQLPTTPPVVQPPLAQPTPSPTPTPTTPFFMPTPVLTPIVAIVPPPPPPAVQTTPPSGTSPVTQAATSPEPEEEEEAAIESAHHMAALKREPRTPFVLESGDDSGQSRVIYAVPALILFLAVAGAATFRPRGRHDRPAYAFNSTPGGPDR